jgi:hypothetical protein
MAPYCLGLLTAKKRENMCGAGEMKEGDVGSVAGRVNLKI